MKKRIFSLFFAFVLLFCFVCPAFAGLYTFEEEPDAEEADIEEEAEEDEEETDDEPNDSNEDPEADDR